ncbi:TetR/AcrR family transcriptional regulator [Parapedomonas caeni]
MADADADMRQTVKPRRRPSRGARAMGAGDERTTKERILDAAEALFSLRGYHGVGLREITGHAGVELGLVNYHFGAKEELFRQVVGRRAESHCDALMGSLAEATRAAGDRPPGVEAIIAAFCHPIFERTQFGGQGWKNYIRLLGQVADSPERGPYMQPFNERYDPVVTAYIAALQRALPAASPENLYSSFYFLQGSIVYLVAETGAIDALSAGMVRSGDFRALEARLVPFFAAGFYRLAGC